MAGESRFGRVSAGRAKPLQEFTPSIPAHSSRAGTAARSTRARTIRRAPRAPSAARRPPQSRLAPRSTPGRRGFNGPPRRGTWPRLPQVWRRVPLGLRHRAYCPWPGSPRVHRCRSRLPGGTLGLTPILTRFQRPTRGASAAVSHRAHGRRNSLQTAEAR